MIVEPYISWNLRGANSSLSRFLVRQLVNKLHPTVLFIQETKCLAWNKKLIESLGMGSDVDWVEAPSRGFPGGLLTLWQVGAFKLISFKSNPNWILFRGALNDEKGIAFLNVYAPQNRRQKRVLWGDLLYVL